MVAEEVGVEAVVVVVEEEVVFQEVRHNVL